MNIQILKNSTQDEINQIIELIRFNSNLNWSDEQIVECFNNSQNIIIAGILDKDIVGIMFLSYIFDSADILYLCVAKKFRQQNIASRLISESLKIISEYKVENLLLEVSINNMAAISLYTKMGFKKISVRKNYYVHNNEYIDALVYQYSI